MINMTIVKNDGKIFFAGIEKSDLEALAKDAVLTFDLPIGKVALAIVKSSREEFVANVRKMTGTEAASPTEPPANA